MAKSDGFVVDLLKKVIKIILKNLFKVKKSNPNQHVVPHDGDWAIKGEGNEKYTGIFETQSAAIERAKEIATNYRSSVIIHSRDGSIRDQISYK